MSVLVRNRSESKFEPIVYSIELQNMLLDFVQRSFGVRDINKFVRSKFLHGKTTKEEHSKYRFAMYEFQGQIMHLTCLLTNNVRAANTIYPTTMHEYEKRRDFQNGAIVACQEIINILQQAVTLFDVDVNIYDRYVKAIEREINLIKKWRQRDNKIKSYLEQQGNV